MPFLSMTGNLKKVLPYENDSVKINYDEMTEIEI
jgi:hypothetical protein